MEGMLQAGYEVYGISSDGPECEKVRARGIRVVPVEILRRIHPVHDYRVVRELVGLFRKLRLDILHTHTPKAAFLGQVAARLAGIPIRINTVHGLYYHAFEKGLKRSLYRTLELQTCRIATHVLSQSEEDATALVKEARFPSRKVEWLGNGIDLARFDPDRFNPDQRRHIRRELGVPEGVPVVGIIARMVQEKGLLDLFAAVAKLRERIPDLWLVHVGFCDFSRSGGLGPEVAKEYGIYDQSVFCGQRNDVERILATMDVYCLPSYREGYPRSVLEANAMALPAVVTDIRGCREAVIDGFNGLLVPAKEPELLSKALARILENDELRASLAGNARRRAVEAFDEQRVVAKVLEVYERQLRRINRMRGARPGS
jgi:glycosyltransferase involved in cell wall biosynthesis